MANEHIADKDIRADVEVCRVIDRHIRDSMYDGTDPKMAWIGFKLLGLRVALPVDGAVMRIAYWDHARKSRYVMKVGKFMNKFFKERCHLSDHGVQTAGSGVCAELWAGSIGDGVTLYSGNDIKKQYLELDAVHSCMSHGHTNSYLDLYCKNPDKVQLAVVNNDLGQLRALVWTCKKTDGTEVRVLSVPYFSTNAAEAVLTQWADAEGIAYRSRSGNTPYVTVVMKYDMDSEWPYIDRLCYVTDNGNGTVTLSTDDGEYEAQSTEGELNGYNDGRGRCTCENCGNRIHEDDSYSDPGDNTLCIACYDDLCSYCECCGETEWSNEMRCVEGGRYDYVCQGCADHSYTECEDCGNLVPNDHVIEIKSGAFVCTKCWEEAYSTCGVCDETVKCDEGKSVANGDWLCDDCLEETHFECCDCCELFPNEIDKGDELCTDCAMERMENLCSSTTEG